MLLNNGCKATLLRIVCQCHCSGLRDVLSSICVVGEVCQVPYRFFQSPLPCVSPDSEELTKASRRNLKYLILPMNMMPSLLNLGENHANAITLFF